jgi:DNA-binding CsgD family transcriptional regulator
VVSSRSISPELLVKYVRKIGAGEIWIDNLSANKLLEAYRYQTTVQDGPRTQPRLTQRAGIITCITQGKRNKEIASQLGTTEQVIKNFLRRVYDKLGVADRLELAIFALNHQWQRKVSNCGSLRAASVLRLPDALQTQLALQGLSERFSLNSEAWPCHGPLPSTPVC